MINSFKGENYFLSNFYMAPVCYEGIMYLNNEAAFQAAKIKDLKERENFQALCDGKMLPFSKMNPSDAKRNGRRVNLRPDWESVKTDVMRDIVYDKFKRNPELRKMLLDTGNEPLEEGNTWGDRVWGTVNGSGENRLGKILMNVRTQLRLEG